MTAWSAAGALLIAGALILQACAASSPAATPLPTASPVPTGTATAAPTSAPTSTSIPPTSTPQPRLTLVPSGPELEDFPAGVSPLTGQAVEDPALLGLPAVLVSISNMPPTARPQAGLSFAPWVYEMFIGEGTTRFMSIFYGSLPRRIPSSGAGCPVSPADARPAGTWLGGRAWLDENHDGVQQPWEAGVGGVCVDLLETGGRRIAHTSTDSNGYFALDAASLAAGAEYNLNFALNDAYQFSPPNVGSEDQDSDPDPQTGLADLHFQGASAQRLDAGLVLVKPGPPVYATSEIAPSRTYVGPIRSGRLTYNDFVRMYPAGCLIYASAGNGIRQQLQGCEIIFGEQPDVSPNTALLDVSRLKELALKSKIDKQPVNYSGHLFDPAPPAGGEPADTLWTYFHAFSQSFWRYDPLSGSYLRQTDDGDGRGIFHVDTDRLTGRQLAFENLAIILANYDVFRHGQYDIALCCGLEGYAFIFRDGRMYRVRWSTNNRAWEQKTGLLRPLHFTGADRQPFPLKPGRTWVSIMTFNSAIKDLHDGNWQAIFAMPDDLATPEP